MGSTIAEVQHPSLCDVTEAKEEATSNPEIPARKKFATILLMSALSVGPMPNLILTLFKL